MFPIPFGATKKSELEVSINAAINKFGITEFLQLIDFAVESQQEGANQIRTLLEVDILSVITKVSGILQKYIDGRLNAMEKITAMKSKTSDELGESVRKHVEISDQLNELKEQTKPSKHRIEEKRQSLKYLASKQILLDNQMEKYEHLIQMQKRESDELLQLESNITNDLMEKIVAQMESFAGRTSSAMTQLLKAKGKFEVERRKSLSRKGRRMNVPETTDMNLVKASTFLQRTRKSNGHPPSPKGDDSPSNRSPMHWGPGPPLPDIVSVGKNQDTVYDYTRQAKLEVYTGKTAVGRTLDTVFPIAELDKQVKSPLKAGQNPWTMLEKGEELWHTHPPSIESESHDNSKQFSTWLEGAVKSLFTDSDGDVAYIADASRGIFSLTFHEITKQVRTHCEQCAKLMAYAWNRYCVHLEKLYAMSKKEGGKYKGIIHGLNMKIETLQADVKDMANQQTVLLERETRSIRQQQTLQNVYFQEKDLQLKTALDELQQKDTHIEHWSKLLSAKEKLLLKRNQTIRKLENENRRLREHLHEKQIQETSTRSWAVEKVMMLRSVGAGNVMKRALHHSKILLQEEIQKTEEVAKIAGSNDGVGMFDDAEIMKKELTEVEAMIRKPEMTVFNRGCQYEENPELGDHQVVLFKKEGVTEESAGPNLMRMDSDDEEESPEDKEYLTEDLNKGLASLSFYGHCLANDLTQHLQRAEIDLELEGITLGGILAGVTMTPEGGIELGEVADYIRLRREQRILNFGDLSGLEGVEMAGDLLDFLKSQLVDMTDVDLPEILNSLAPTGTEAINIDYVVEMIKTQRRNAFHKRSEWISFSDIKFMTGQTSVARLSSLLESHNVDLDGLTVENLLQMYYKKRGEGNLSVELSDIAEFVKSHRTQILLEKKMAKRRWKKLRAVTKLGAFRLSKNDGKRHIQLQTDPNLTGTKAIPPSHVVTFEPSKEEKSAGRRQRTGSGHARSGKHGGSKKNELRKETTPRKHMPTKARCSRKDVLIKESGTKKPVLVKSGSRENVLGTASGRATANECDDINGCSRVYESEEDDAEEDDSESDGESEDEEDDSSTEGSDLRTNTTRTSSPSRSTRRRRPFASSRRFSHTQMKREILSKRIETLQTMPAAWKKFCLNTNKDGSPVGVELSMKALHATIWNILEGKIDVDERMSLSELPVQTLQHHTVDMYRRQYGLKALAQVRLSELFRGIIGTHLKDRFVKEFYRFLEYNQLDMWSLEELNFVLAVLKNLRKNVKEREFGVGYEVDLYQAKQAFLVTSRFPCQPALLEETVTGLKSLSSSNKENKGVLPLYNLIEELVEYYIAEKPLLRQRLLRLMSNNPDGVDSEGTIPFESYKHIIRTLWPPLAESTSLAVFVREVVLLESGSDRLGVDELMDILVRFNISARLFVVRPEAEGDSPCSPRPTSRGSPKEMNVSGQK